jgi:FlaA1/EpsC-like NDP-sugar epimerase
MERFFMTIPEACQLIMQAAALGKGGEIFVLDMGEPVRIKYLAEQMILLSGRRPGDDIPIRYIGLRPGEKLTEELFYEGEDLAGTSHPKIRTARGSDAPAWDLVQRQLAACETAVDACDEERMHAALAALVPQWAALAPTVPPTQDARVTLEAASG